MQQNNESQGMIMAMALVGAVAFFAFAFIFALAVFASLVLTGICFTAWRRPVELFGETLTPDEARAFVRRGVMGAILVPTFALFCSGLFGVTVREEFWLYLPLGGYAFGSLVVTYHIEKAKLEAKQQEAATKALLPPAPPAQSRAVRTIDASPSAQPVQEAQPQAFRFATWDDEEELRK